MPKKLTYQDTTHLHETTLALVQTIHENSGIPQHTLAALAGIKPSICSARICSLIERGLVTRTTYLEKGQTIRPLRLTALGRQQLARQLPGDDAEHIAGPRTLSPMKGGNYLGTELRPYTGRPGALDFLRPASRMGERLVAHPSAWMAEATA